MTKLQWLVVFGSLALFVLMYFGCDRVPPEQESVEASRSLSAQTTNLGALLMDAKSKLSAEEANTILALESQVEAAVDESERIKMLKQLSGKWFDFGRPAIAGGYARQIAEAEGTEESWSIAGTTFAIGIQRSNEPKIRKYCTEQAVQAFENAISVNPNNLDHKVNLALCYVENPPEAEPMKGIQMLIGLNQQNPDNVLVLNNLGRLAIRTGQYDRAIQRLERALSLEPANQNTICLLAQAYGESGDREKAQAMEEKCATAR